MKILVVDDEPLVRSLISLELQDEGYETFEAGNGIEALELMSQQRIDLVISDVRMPVCGGVELLDTIMNTPSVGRPAVIFVSGFSDISLEEAYDRGVQAVLSKPIDHDELQENVRRVLRGSVIVEKAESVNANHRQQGNTSSDLSSDLPIAVLTSHGKSVQLGRGGLFLPLTSNFPVGSESLRFSIVGLDGSAETFEGLGVVRWVRRTETSELMSGIGLEFLALTASASATLHRFVASAGGGSFGFGSSCAPRAFIPRGNKPDSHTKGD